MDNVRAGPGLVTLALLDGCRSPRLPHQWAGASSRWLPTSVDMVGGCCVMGCALWSTGVMPCVECTFSVSVPWPGSPLAGWVSVACVFRPARFLFAGGGQLGGRSRRARHEHF